MYSLKDITTLRRVSGGGFQSVLAENAENCEQLQQIISQNPDLANYDIRDYLKKAEIRVKRYSKKEEPIVFDFLTYRNSLLNENRLQAVDSFVSSNVLLLESPFCIGGLTYRNIRTFDIKTLKHLMSHTHTNGGLCAHIHRVGKAKLQKLKESIDFYDTQVVRQACDYPNNAANEIFFADIELKRELLIDCRRNFLDYLFNLSHEFVFGKITERQMESLYGAKKLTDGTPLIELLTMLANYTTFKELNTQPEEVLNRFVLKRE